MEWLKGNTIRSWAIAGIVTLVLMAAVGPEATTALTGFGYDEQHTAFPFTPPGFSDVPERVQSFDGDQKAFDLLVGKGTETIDPAARGDDAAIGYTIDHTGAARCPLVQESAQAFREISMLMADAWQGGGTQGEVDTQTISEELAQWPVWSREVLIECAPYVCSLDVLMGSTRFLRITEEGLASMDVDKNGVVARNEFLGAPKLKSHLLGSDGLGRDSLVRLLRGLRMSVIVGGIAALVASIIGVAYGAAAGISGGMVGGAMMRFVDILYGLPYIFIVILLISIVGPSTMNLLLAIASVQWLGMSRTVRGLVGSLLTTQYVEAARTLGCGPVRLVFSHLIPNARRPIVTWSALLVPASIKEEAFLSFLGLGVQAPDASLGTLIADGAPRIGEYPWLVVAPSIILFLLVLLINVACDEEKE